MNKNWTKCVDVLNIPAWLSVVWDLPRRSVDFPKYSSALISQVFKFDAALVFVFISHVQLTNKIKICAVRRPVRLETKEFT